MSKSSKGRSDEALTQFIGLTGASPKDAKKFLDRYKRLDLAVDAFFDDPNAMASVRRQPDAPAPSTSKLNTLFDKYKDPEGSDITINGTIQMCEDLEVDPEDVVLLAIAYELKSPRVGEWSKKGWVEGWKRIGCDNIADMKTALTRLRNQLGSDPKYFQKVYGHTFDFARSEGQRSLGLETAQAYWSLLLPYGLEHGALSHVSSTRDDENSDEEDVDMDASEEGWKPEYTEWWFEFLNEKGGKGVSKDTWSMFLDFVRTVDSKFEKYDPEAAWPSTIDDFVDWAKARLQS